MYTTDRAEQALDDIRKVFLLYERGILLDDNVKSLTNKIVNTYLTKSLVANIDGQSCKTCLYYKNGYCYAKKYAPYVDPNDCCDSWEAGIKLNEVDDNGKTKEGK